MTTLILTTGVFAQGIGVQAREPNPFRGDDGQIFGRDFEFTSDGIAIRSLYRFHPHQVEAWASSREGFRGIAGSVTSDEFYTYQELRKTFPVDGPVFFGFRYRRDEDFDSRYTRAQIGIGTELGRGWTASLYSEIVAEKAGIDVQPEIAWSDDAGNHFRVAAVWVDATFDRKSEVDEYEQQPWTFFTEGTVRPTPESRITGWINWSPQLERTFVDEMFQYHYRSVSGGVETSWQLSDNWGVRAAARGEQTDSSIRYVDRTDTRDRRLSRRFWQVEAEVRRRLNDRSAVWCGARYFRLSENDRRPRDAALDLKLQRHEPGVYIGVDVPLHERVLFWPSLHLDALRNRDDFSGDALRSDTDHEYLVILAMPAEIDVGRGAKLTVQANLTLSEPEFGGGAMQLYVPF